MDEAGEVDGASIVSCSEAAEMFEAVEASLDAIAVFVDGCVMRDSDLAAAVRRDHDRGSHAGDERRQGIAVIGFVGEYGAARLVFEQGRGLGDVAGLPGRDDEAERPAKRIASMWILVVSPPRERPSA